MPERIRCTVSTQDDGGCPPPREQIRTLDTFNDEDRALEFLDKLIYAIGTETSQPGIGALKNTDMSPFVLKEHSVTRPVSVYREDGTWAADWDSIVEACHSLGIRRNAAQDSLLGKNWCSCGYQLREKGSRSVLTLPVKEGESGSMTYRATSLLSTPPLA